MPGTVMSWEGPILGTAVRVTYDARAGVRPPGRNIRLDKPGNSSIGFYCKEARVPLLTRIRGPRDLDRLRLDRLLLQGGTGAAADPHQGTALSGPAPVPPCSKSRS